MSQPKAVPRAMPEDDDAQASASAVHPPDPALAQLSERVTQLQADQMLLHEELARLRALVSDRRCVDLVNFNRISVFLYKDDLAHEGVAQPARGYTIAQHEEKMAAMDLSDSTATAPRYPVEDQLDVTKCIFEHFWELGREPDYLDIGANYAVLSLVMGDFFRAAGRSSRVIGFEPGTSCDLARYSTRLNQLEEIVSIERLAISNRPGLEMVFHEAGHTENNRIVNRMPETESLSFVMPTTSVDAYLEELSPDRLDQDYVVKIDTQASEHLVLEGMAQMRARGQVAMLIEFDPHNLQYQIDCEVFLAGLAKGAQLFEIAPRSPGSERTPGPQLVRVDTAQHKTLRDEVLGREITFTDLVVLPNDLPGLDTLVDRLLGG